MPQYLAPGVYIEEMPGPKPFQEVGTATGDFIGIAERGPIGEAKLVTNWTQFVETFGGFIPSGYLAYAVNQFFTEGGTKCWVVRTCHYDYNQPLPAPHLASKGNITLLDNSSAETLKVEALREGSWSDHVWAEIADAKKDPTNKFRMSVWFKGVEVEVYEELMQQLEAEGELERDIEFLPTTEEMLERRAAGHGLTRPEMSVLLAYAKRSVYQALLGSDLPDSEYLTADLERYFPSPEDEAEFPEPLTYRRADEIEACHGS